MNRIVISALVISLLINLFGYYRVVSLAGDLQLSNDRSAAYQVEIKNLNSAIRTSSDLLVSYGQSIRDRERELSEGKSKIQKSISADQCYSRRVPGSAVEELRKLAGGDGE